jgi:hypothetical protein
MKSIKFIILCLTFMLTSCMSYMNKKANPYYFGMKVINQTKLKKSKEAKIYDYTEDKIKYFLERGYVVKAKSAFRNTFVHLSWAELAAKQMGSDIVLCKREYVGTASGRSVIPWYVPGETYTVTSRTSGSVSANGYGNTTVIGSNGYSIGSSSSSAYGTYNSNTTTTIQAPGKYEYYSVPYSYNYYDQYAVFLVKEQDILDSERRESKNTEKVIIGENYKTKYKIPIDSEPLTSGSKIIGYIPKNKNILVIQKVNQFFYKIEYKNKIGYIRTDWIDN